MREAAVEKIEPEPLIEPQLSSALLGIAAGATICIAMVSVCVYLIQDYGAALFMGTPIIMGATSAYIYNRPYIRGVLASILVAELSIFLSGLILLLFAFEGIICLGMLLPIAGGMAILGALIGIMIASIQPQETLRVEMNRVAPSNLHGLTPQFARRTSQSVLLLLPTDWKSSYQ